jgi:hypothetical protein
VFGAGIANRVVLLDAGERLGISKVVPAIRSSKPRFLVAGRLRGALRVANRRSTRSARQATSQKAAACFARRVKLGSQKYISFRIIEIMI